MKVGTFGTLEPHFQLAAIHRDFLLTGISVPPFQRFHFAIVGGKTKLTTVANATIGNHTRFPAFQGQ